MNKEELIKLRNSVKDLDYYKNIKGFDCNDKNLEEKLFEYIEAIQEF